MSADIDQLTGQRPARATYPKCHYCHRPLDRSPGGMPTRDHKQPLSRGGRNEPRNIAPCCYQCNHTKGNMTEAEFFTWIAEGRPNKRAYLRRIGL